MIVVCNRIRVKSGMALKMAPMFTKPGPLQQFTGFHKVEVLVASLEDHDEMNVNMYWDDMASFQVWRDSDAFKQAHRRPEGSDNTESPVLGSTLLNLTVAATVAAAP